MKAPYPASEKQVSFLNSLMKDREHALTMEDIDCAVHDKQVASRMIDALLKSPKKANPEVVAEVGMYRLGETIYKVQKTRDGERFYAKRLVQIGGNRLTEINEVVKFEFDYDPGAIKNLKPEHRLSLEEAKAFGIKYGVCCVCSATLSDAKSVANGIGPVCAKRV